MEPTESINTLKEMKREDDDGEVVAGKGDQETTISGSLMEQDDPPSSKESVQQEEIHNNTPSHVNESTDNQVPEEGRKQIKDDVPPESPFIQLRKTQCPFLVPFEVVLGEAAQVDSDHILHSGHFHTWRNATLRELSCIIRHHCLKAAASTPSLSFPATFSMTFHRKSSEARPSVVLGVVCNARKGQSDQDALSTLSFQVGDKLWVVIEDHADAPRPSTTTLKMDENNEMSARRRDPQHPRGKWIEPREWTRPRGGGGKIQGRLGPREGGYPYRKPIGGGW